MIQYDITIDGAYITFTGDDGSTISYKKSLVKKLTSNTANSFLDIITIDDDADSYNYTQVNDPSTGSPFADLASFRTYLITELSN